MDYNSFHNINNINQYLMRGKVSLKAVLLSNFKKGNGLNGVSGVKTVG